MWDTSSGQCLKTLVHDDSVPMFVSPSSPPSSPHFLLRTQISLSCMFFHLFPTHRAHISFTPNGRHVLSTTLDSTARLWDYHTSKCMKTYQGGVLEKWGCPSGFLLHPRRPTSKSKRGTKKDLKGKGREVDMGASKESSNGVEAGLVVENGVGEEEQEVWVVGGSEDGRVLGWEVQSRKIVLDLQASTGSFRFLCSLCSRSLLSHTLTNCILVPVLVETRSHHFCSCSSSHSPFPSSRRLVSSLSSLVAELNLPSLSCLGCSVTPFFLVSPQQPSARISP